ncbi:glutathione S-transferase N-terminal domain-containing protein [Candidatus Woesearchaeota archaeon]|nr:glutathione S-transferase N-terminal domain-containing protein [Candidatus Woesearchaeota archaeon]
MIQKIILYQFEFCPFCELVREKLKEKKIKYAKINVSSDRNDKLRKELKEKSKVETVPILKINNKYIGDSKKIIKYLEENF